MPRPELVNRIPQAGEGAQQGVVIDTAETDGLLLFGLQFEIRGPQHVVCRAAPSFAQALWKPCEALARWAMLENLRAELFTPRAYTHALVHAVGQEWFVLRCAIEHWPRHELWGLGTDLQFRKVRLAGSAVV